MVQINSLLHKYIMITYSPLQLEAVQINEACASLKKEFEERLNIKLCTPKVCL